jgi:hypothetical protein
VIREGDQCLHIHLNFGAFLLEAVGKKFADQAESRIIDKEVHQNPTTLKLFGDGLRTARISQINAENGALNPYFA